MTLAVKGNPRTHRYDLYPPAGENGANNALGVGIDPETGIPNHDKATMESDVDGIYIAGVLAAGYNANKIFIENGREHGGLIVADHLARQGA